MNYKHLESALNLINEPLLSINNTSITNVVTHKYPLTIAVKLNYVVDTVVSKDTGSYVNGFTDEHTYKEAICDHQISIKKDTLNVYETAIRNAISENSLAVRAKEFTDDFSEFQEFAYNYECVSCNGVGSHVCRECNGVGTKTVQSYNMVMRSKHVLRNNEWVYENVSEKEYYDKEEKCRNCNGEGYIDCKACDGSGGLVELTRVSGKLKYQTEFSVQSLLSTKVQDTLNSKFENNPELVLKSFEAKSFNNNVLNLNSFIDFYCLTINTHNQDFNLEYASVENDAGKVGNILYKTDKILDTIYNNNQTKFYDPNDVCVALEFLKQPSSFKNIYNNLVQLQKTNKITLSEIKSEVKALNEFTSNNVQALIVASLQKIFKDVAVSHNTNYMIISNIICLMISVFIAYSLKASMLLTFIRISQVSVVTSLIGALLGYISSNMYVNYKHKVLQKINTSEDYSVIKPKNLSLKVAIKEMLPLFLVITMVVNIIISSNIIKV